LEIANEVGAALAAPASADSAAKGYFTLAGVTVKKNRRKNAKILIKLP